jgi:hypothetical protein
MARAKNDELLLSDVGPNYETKMPMKEIASLRDKKNKDTTIKVNEKVHYLTEIPTGDRKKTKHSYKWTTVEA